MIHTCKCSCGKHFEIKDNETYICECGKIYMYKDNFLNFFGEKQFN
jgi:hypothetical protein